MYIYGEKKEEPCVLSVFVTYLLSVIMKCSVSWGLFCAVSFLVLRHFYLVRIQSKPGLESSSKASFSYHQLRPHDAVQNSLQYVHLCRSFVPRSQISCGCSVSPRNLPILPDLVAAVSTVTHGSFGTSASGRKPKLLITCLDAWFAPIMRTWLVLKERKKAKKKKNRRVPSLILKQTAALFQAMKSHETTTRPDLAAVCACLLQSSAPLETTPVDV